MVKTQKGPLSFSLSSIFCGLGLLVGVPCFATDDPLARARAILARHPIVDGHNDLPWAIRESASAPRDVAAYDLRRRTTGEGESQKAKTSDPANEHRE